YTRAIQNAIANAKTLVVLRATTASVFAVAICDAVASWRAQPTITTRHSVRSIATTYSIVGNASSAKKSSRGRAGGESCVGATSVGSIIATSARPICCLIALGYPGGQNVNLTQKALAKRALFSASERVRSGVGRRAKTSTGYSSAMTMW